MTEQCLFMNSMTLMLQLLHKSDFRAKTETQGSSRLGVFRKLGKLSAGAPDQSKIQIIQT